MSYAAETPLYPIGTLLDHRTLGRVTYWRHAPECGPDRHVVYAAARPDEGYYVSTENLTTV